MRRALAVLVVACALVVDAPGVAADDLTPQCRIWRTGETRPMNTAANSTVPRRALPGWPSWAFDDSSYRRHVNGRYAGSTDQILQWAACKWQVPVDVLRGVAAQESWWDATTIGDEGQSFGLMQVKVGAATNTGVTVGMAQASAWNVDYYAATLRACLDGHMVLWRDHPELTSRAYTSGDLWGCVEAWYTGVGPTEWSAWYPARVQQYMTERRWEQPDFLAWTGWADWCATATPAEAAGYWMCR